MTALRNLKELKSSKCMSDHNEIKLKINKERYMEKSPQVGNLTTHFWIVHGANAYKTRVRLLHNIVYLLECLKTKTNKTRHSTKGWHEYKTTESLIFGWCKCKML